LKGITGADCKESKRYLKNVIIFNYYRREYLENYAIMFCLFAFICIQVFEHIY